MSFVVEVVVYGICCTIIINGCLVPNWNTLLMVVLLLPFDVENNNQYNLGCIVVLIDIVWNRCVNIIIIGFLFGCLLYDYGCCFFVVGVEKTNVVVVRCEVVKQTVKHPVGIQTFPRIQYKNRVLSFSFFLQHIG